MSKKEIDVKKATLLQIATLYHEHKEAIKAMEKKLDIYKQELIRREAKQIPGFSIAITEETRFNSAKFLESLVSKQKIQEAKESGKFTSSYKKLLLKKV